jgi:hypothetical protein
MLSHKAYHVVPSNWLTVFFDQQQSLQSCRAVFPTMSTISDPLRRPLSSDGTWCSSLPNSPSQLLLSPCKNLADHVCFRSEKLLLYQEYRLCCGDCCSLIGDGIRLLRRSFLRQSRSQILFVGLAPAVVTQGGESGLKGSFQSTFSPLK